MRLQSWVIGGTAGAVNRFLSIIICVEKGLLIDREGRRLKTKGPQGSLFVYQLSVNSWTIENASKKMENWRKESWGFFCVQLDGMARPVMVFYLHSASKCLNLKYSGIVYPETMLWGTKTSLNCSSRSTNGLFNEPWLSQQERQEKTVPVSNRTAWE
jgi:hypothetical protein